MSKDYAAMVLADGPLAYWRLNEASSPFGDSTGHGYPVTGGSTGSSRGSGALVEDPDASRWFDGLAGQQIGYADLRSPSLPMNLVLGALTFECWAWVDFNPNASPSWSPTMHEYNLVGHFADVGMSLRCFGGNPSSFSVDPWLGGNAGTWGNFTFGAWHHFVLAYVGFGSSSRTLYVDGVVIGTDLTATAGDMSNFVSLGNAAYWGPGFYDTNLRGRLDEVAIYPFALSAQRALDHYRLGLQPTGEHWPIQSRSGVIALRGITGKPL